MPVQTGNRSLGYNHSQTVTEQLTELRAKVAQEEQRITDVKSRRASLVASRDAAVATRERLLPTPGGEIFFDDESWESWFHAWELAQQQPEYQAACTQHYSAYQAISVLESELGRREQRLEALRARVAQLEQAA